MEPHVGQGAPHRVAKNRGSARPVEAERAMSVDIVYYERREVYGFMVGKMGRSVSSIGHHRPWVGSHDMHGNPRGR